MSSPPPSLVDNESRVPNVIAMVAGTLAVASITTAARFYTRAVMLKQLWFDDWFALLSLGCVIGCGVAIAVNTQNGLGRHIWIINMANFPQYLKVFYVSIVMYGAAITAIKVTFLLQYQRVFSVGSWWNRFTLALLIVTGWSVASLLVSIWSCVPAEGFWDQSVHARCIPNHPWWEINAAGNIVTDFAVFCLPIPTLWRLQLPKNEKFALLGIFCLGFFTCAISLVRIKYLQIAADMTWENVDSGTWSMLEIVSGVVCANLATLRPLLKTIFPFLGGSTNRSGASDGTGEKGSNRRTGRSGGASGLHRSTPGSDQVALGAGSDGSSPKVSSSHHQGWTEHPGQGKYEATATAGNGIGFPSPQQPLAGDGKQSQTASTKVRDLEQGNGGRLGFGRWGR